MNVAERTIAPTAAATLRVKLVKLAIVCLPRTWLNLYGQQGLQGACQVRFSAENRHFLMESRPRAPVEPAPSWEKSPSLGTQAGAGWTHRQRVAFRAQIKEGWSL